MTRRDVSGIDGDMPHASHRARIAVAAVFFANGAGFASWVPHIPMVQAKLGLTAGVLGGALLAMAAGALAGIRFSGWATARAGSPTVVRASALLFFVALPLPLLAPRLAILVVALFLFGAGNGALDVSMNAQAVALEARWPRPIMSSFHGMWSLGGLVGATAAAVALAAGVPPLPHLLVATALLAAVTAAAATALLPPDADVRSGAPRFARPTRAMLGLGLVAFLALLSEGAMGDWSAVYLRHSLGTTGATAALGFAAFSLTMAAGRFLGDGLVARFGDERVVRRSTASAALGLGAALVVAHPIAAILGFATVGFGIANLIPIAFRTAGTLPGVAASQGIAAVGTFGYVGFLAGPPLIGLAADLVTLPAALGIVVAALAWIALATPTLGAARATVEPIVTP
jgi:predicted MFS family arabinose efflux permease